MMIPVSFINATKYLDKQMTDNELNEPIQDIPYRNLKPSRRLIANYGTLFMLWGWAGLIKYILDYIREFAILSIIMRQSVTFLGYFVVILWLGGTLYFLYHHSQMKLTYFGLVLRFIWISMVLSMVLISMIQMNILSQVNFELQHSVFMVLYAFSAVVSGGILKQRSLIIGGVLFAVCAFISSYFELRAQMALETVGWIVAFIIPGHVMFAQGNNEKSIHLYQ